ncbi:MAG: family 1 glycosylhydrolase [Gemmatimonadota bacterium]|nr:family 1 glycosylhydrolase [Gemmatimonadota bacterium]
MKHPSESAYFIFATGIENSYPTIRNGTLRVDEMAKCLHYDNWRRDFELAQSIGVTHLRYGPPLFSTWTGAGRYDWSFADETFADLKRRQLFPIADLCHFGVPDWIGNFQNPDFPKLFADYARAFAQRFPWVQLYTPVNEMYVCAIFSGKFGWWNEQLSSDYGFVTALKHLATANVLAMRAILEVRPDAIFIQSESSEYFHAGTPSAIAPAELMNEVRFLSLDLNYGKRVSSEMYEYLTDNGMTREEYHFFLGGKLKRHCIMGNDYYATNEHLVDQDGSSVPSGEIFGYYVITMQYYDRYRVPVMHTETNCRQGKTGDEAVLWLRKEWANVMRVRNDGVPIVGFTWYSLTDQVDWDTALREPNGNIDPLGLFDLDRNIRPVGTAYQTLIREWAAVLPTQSVVLALPIDQPVRSSENQSTVDAADRPARTVAPRPDVVSPRQPNAQAPSDQRNDTSNGDTDDNNNQTRVTA